MKDKKPPKVTGDGDVGRLLAARAKALLKRKPPSDTPPSLLGAKTLTIGSTPETNKKAKANDNEKVKIQSIILESSPRFVAIAWGWNSNGRSGNLTEENIRFPKQIQRSKQYSWIDCAAGKHHSLVIDQNGNVHSFGDGRKGQLGYGSWLNPEEQLDKGGIVQAVARHVNPSGAYVYKRDFKYAQVACGDTFSIARELSPDEGAAIVVGFVDMEKAFIRLMKLFDGNERLRRVWGEIRQERFAINKGAGGHLVSWGTGEKGQLGLGKHVQFSASPHLVFSVRDSVITQVSVGESHVLAIDSNGRLFSWGSGKSGKLGHGDYNDRVSPEVVKYFSPLFVECCAAGKAHSAVLTTTRHTGNNVSRAMQQRRVAAFGRGAHGRLGYGSNRTHPLPVLVTRFPPSIDGMQFHQIACGGAHTVMLVEKTVSKCLLNPYGKQTYIVTWGFGENGQLGDGLMKHSFTAVRARTPRCEIFVEVSAGQSWTIARTVTGQLYSWGKGLRGQLGQANAMKLGTDIAVTSLCAVPKLVPDCFASIMRITSGYAHNLAIGVAKKYLNSELILEEAKKNPFFDPFDKHLLGLRKTLKSTASVSMRRFDCCRRHVPSGFRLQYKNERFVCVSCHLMSICRDCATQCHRGHKLSLHSSMMEETMNKEEAFQLARRNIFVDNTVASRYATTVSRNRAAPEKYPRSSTPSRMRIVIRPWQENSQSISSYSSSSSANKRKDGRRDKIGSTGGSAVGSPTQQHYHRKHSSPPKQLGGGFPEQIKRRIGAPSLPPPPPPPKKSTVPPYVPQIETNPYGCRCGVLNPYCRMIPVIKEETISPDKYEEMPTYAALVESQQYVKQGAKSGPGKGQSKKNGSMSPVKHRLSDAMQSLSSSVASTFAKTRRTPAAMASPVVQEAIARTSAAKEALRQSNKVSAGELRALQVMRVAGYRIYYSAWKIQRLGRRYNAAKSAYKAFRDHELIRFAVCSAYVETAIMKPIWFKLHRQCDQFYESRELTAMRIEDELQKKYVYYEKVQKAIMGIEAVSFGVRQLVGDISAQIPRMKDGIAIKELYKEKAGNGNEENDSTVPIVLSEFIPAAESSVSLLQAVPNGKSSKTIKTLKSAASKPTFKAPTSIPSRSTLQSEFVGTDSDNDFVPPVVTTSKPKKFINKRVNYSSFGFSWVTIREQQLRMHPSRRVSPHELAHITGILPRENGGIYKEGRFFDLDMELFTKRFVQDNASIRFQIRRKATIDKMKADRQRMAELALAKMMAAKHARDDVLAQANAITNGTKPPPPPGPPPRHLVLQQREAAKAATRAQRIRDVEMEERIADAPFHAIDNAAAIPAGSLQELRRKRRNSIGDPCDLTSRLRGMRDHLELISSAKRRDSIPAKLNALHVFTLPPNVETIKQVQQSLELFSLRQASVVRLIEGIKRADADEEFAKTLPKNFLTKCVRKKYAGCFMTPRLPREMNDMLQDGERRRTIGEPERFNRHLNIMLETRDKFSDLVEECNSRWSMNRRRRSFDHGEEMDHVNGGIDELLGFGLETECRASTTASLSMEAAAIGGRMLEAGLLSEEEAARARLKLSAMSASGKFKTGTGGAGSRKSTSKKRRKGGTTSRDTKPTVKGARAVAFADDEYEEYDAEQEEEGGVGNSDGYGYYDNGELFGGADGDAFNTTTAEYDYSAEYWQQHYTEDGQPYFFNSETQQSLWEEPVGDNVHLLTQYEAEDGYWYWYDNITQQSYAV